MNMRWVHRDDHPKVGATELCDEQTCPQENVDIAADPKSAALAATPTAQCLKGWQGAKSSR